MKYRKKIERVDAVRLRDRIIVPVDKTDYVGLKGDWLLVYADGRQAVVTDEAFRREFELDVTTPATPATSPMLPGLPGWTPQRSYPTDLHGAPIVTCQAADAQTPAAS